jgi:hypothetical protein
VLDVDGKRAVVALLLTLIVSCGGAAPTSTGAGASTGATSAAATQAGAATTAATQAGASQPGLSDLLASAKAKEYKVTYKVTATGQGAEALSGDQSWYFKPPRSRIDFTTSLGGQRTTTSIFALPEGSFMCFGPSGQSQCVSTPPTGSPLDQNQVAMIQRAMIDNPGAFGATFTGAKTIAGQSGLCYDVTATAGAFTKGAFCFTKDGIQLLSTFTAQGSSVSMEATSLSLTVPDSDFTLPAKPPGR